MKRLALLAVLFVFSAADPSIADDACSLRQVASMDMGSDVFGRVTVPMTVKGTPLAMLVDTGGYISALNQSVVRKLDLSTTYLMNGRYVQMFGGVHLDQTAEAHDVLLGNMKASSMPVFVVPDGILGGPDGILAPDILGAYDAEFDFANNKFNLYSQDHCDGQVVYWTADPYAAVPFGIEGGTHITVNVTLDGKTFRAVIDTGAARSLMSLDAAKDAFDIADNDPNLKLAPDGHTYTYPFKTLDLQGVSVKNPAFVLMPQSVAKVRGLPDMIIGIGILRQLHLYIAYRERKLYATPASAH
ncbi:MAG TPA: retroviral-like aspartic protease family protein [Rhizomicrobium sp.]|nr:retroviral-like aspartic protease family protein [Rhizomicrobium sp.]